jgi:hypothetical protein
MRHAEGERRRQRLPGAGVVDLAGDTFMPSDDELLDPPGMKRYLVLVEMTASPVRNQPS